MANVLIFIILNLSHTNNHLMQFNLSHLPQIEFGAGKINLLAEKIKHYGDHFLLVTGGQSWQSADWWQPLIQQIKHAQLSFEHVTIANEPSPTLIDEIVNDYKNKDIAVVVGLGGGSAIDAAKAVAGLLLIDHSVMDFLEGVGPELDYKGPSVPFIAVPTTAGTGSEATKNAVLSQQSSKGFKKSFRDDLLIAESAIIDPDLLSSCPPPVLAANGMDALTQLIESYVSLRQNELCNTMGEKAIRHVRDGLITLYESNGSDALAREKMAYGSLMSGINLAQTGLGSVHGLASPLGAFFPIPHGVVCGTLLAKATEVNLRVLLKREPQNPALKQYQHIAQILHGSHFPNQEIAFNALMKRLWLWTNKLNMPRLAEYGISKNDVAHIVNHARGSSMLTNPIVLSDDEIAEIIIDRI